jgi:hypothetical protein
MLLRLGLYEPGIGGTGPEEPAVEGTSVFEGLPVLDAGRLGEMLPIATPDGDWSAVAVATPGTGFVRAELGLAGAELAGTELAGAGISAVPAAEGGLVSGFIPGTEAVAAMAGTPSVGGTTSVRPAAGPLVTVVVSVDTGPAAVIVVVKVTVTGFTGAASAAIAVSGVPGTSAIVRVTVAS